MRTVMLALVAVLAAAIGGPAVLAQTVLPVPDQTPVQAQPEAQPEARPAAPPVQPGVQPPPAAPAQDDVRATQTQDKDQAQIQEQSKTQDRARIPEKTEDSSTPAASARFSLQRVDGGYLRLDNDSGKVAFCAPHDPGWSCQAVSRERSALEKEITGLHDQVTALKGEITGLRDEVTAPKEEITGLHDQVTALKGEIIGLHDEVTALKDEIAALRALPRPSPPPPPADKSGDLTLKLPSSEDIARAGAYVQDTMKDTWRRLVDMIAHFQRDVLRKG